MYNYIWTNDTFPKAWNSATIIPIPKPGKNRTNVKNYRPIALNSDINKLSETIINRRLKWSPGKAITLLQFNMDSGNIAPQVTTLHSLRLSSATLSQTPRYGRILGHRKGLRHGMATPDYRHPHKQVIERPHDSIHRQHPSR